MSCSACSSPTWAAKTRGGSKRGRLVIPALFFPARLSLHHSQCPPRSRSHCLPSRCRGSSPGHCSATCSCSLPTRRAAASRDGLRCLRRYPMLWFTLGVFGFAYALFQLALRIYFYCVLPLADRPVIVWARAAWRDPQLWLKGSPDSLWYLPPQALRQTILENALSAVENVAGLFNVVAATFPISAFAAFLFLINWEGHSHRPRAGLAQAIWRVGLRVARRHRRLRPGRADQTAALRRTADPRSSAASGGGVVPVGAGRRLAVVSLRISDRRVRADRAHSHRLLLGARHQLHARSSARFCAAPPELRDPLGAPRHAGQHAAHSSAAHPEKLPGLAVSASAR